MFQRLRSSCRCKTIASIFVDMENAQKAIWLTALFTLGCVHSLLFSNFHMDYFVSVRAITVAEVTLAQSVYWIWNTANDVFAGWLADTLASYHGSHLPLLLGIHLLWPLASALPFLPVVSTLLSTGYHYLWSISMYDGCVSVAWIARNTFMAQITQTERERVQLQRLNSVFGNLEFLVTLGGFSLWHRRDKSGWGIEYFTGYMLCVCVGSAAISVVSILQLQRHLGSAAPTVDKAIGVKVAPLEVLGTFWTQVQGHRNLWLLIAINVITETHWVLLGQFNLILVAVLLHSLHEGARDTVMAAIPICGGILTLASTFLSERRGIYSVVRGMLKLKMAAGCVLLGLLYAGQSVQDDWRTLWIIAICLVVCNACTQATSAYSPILLANTIDENQLLFCSTLPTDEENQHPNDAKPSESSSLFWALNALCVKPFNSVGPVLGMSVIGSGYQAFVADKDRMVPELQLQKNAGLLLGCSTVVSAGMSLGLWRLYTLHGSYLRQVQTSTSKDVG